MTNVSGVSRKGPAVPTHVMSTKAWVPRQNNWSPAMGNIVRCMYPPAPAMRWGRARETKGYDPINASVRILDLVDAPSPAMLSDSLASDPFVPASKWKGQKRHLSASQDFP